MSAVLEIRGLKSVQTTFLEEYICRHWCRNVT